MELTEILCMLDSAHGPSGDEGDIRAVIHQLARPWADEIMSDVMGNLVARKKGSGPKVMFAAHMDSIGFIVTHIEKEGFLRFGKVGGLHPHSILHTPVRFKSGVQGVISLDEGVEPKDMTLFVVHYQNFRHILFPSLHRNIVDQPRQRAFPNALNPGDILRDAEGSVGLPVGHDVRRPLLPDAGQGLQLPGRGRIEVHLFPRRRAGPCRRRALGRLPALEVFHIHPVGLRCAERSGKVACRHQQEGGGQRQDAFFQS